MDAVDVHPSVGYAANGAVDLPGGDVAAFDEEFPLHLGLAAVFDIKDGEFRQAARSPIVVISVPPHGVNHRMVSSNGPRAQG